MWTSKKTREPAQNRVNQSQRHAAASSVATVATATRGPSDEQLFDDGSMHWQGEQAGSTAHSQVLQPCVSKLVDGKNEKKTG